MKAIQLQVQIVLSKVRSTVFQIFQIRFIRFLMTGFVNTILGYSIYAAFIYIGINYVLAAAFATAIGIVVSFITNSRIVFRHSEMKRIGKFVCVYAVVYCVYIAGIKLQLIFGVNEYIAGLLMTIPNALISYLLMKKYVFN